MNQKTVEINGTIYDKLTGMPIRRTTAAQSQRTSAAAIHRRTQRSTTLSRSYVHRKEPAADTSKQAVSIPVTSGAAKTKPLRSPMIQKYATHPVASASAPAKPLTPPTVHPMVQQVQAARANSQPVKRAPKPSDVIKAEAVKAALESAPTEHHRAPRRLKKQLRAKRQRTSRLLSFASSGAALLLIAGYFTYLNMPNLSVRVAAVQAGVNADYPGYRPSGYSLAGPIAFSNGTVAMQFNSNGSQRNFTLTQTKSGWDSSAVYENYVQPRVKNDTYTTTTNGGLTIYTWSGNAAWVNNGILYTVDGDAPLTPDQVHRMAASM